MRISDWSSDVCSSDLYEDLDRRMREGDISLAIEIPPGFARDIAHGRRVEIGAWIDGAMPTRGETRSEEHTSELQSLMRISYAVFCLKKKKNEKIQCKHLQKAAS